jgi:hypothetical protein
LVVLSWAFFHEYQPKTAYAQAVDDYTSKLTTEAGKLPATKKKLENARLEVQKKAAEWQQIVAVRTPPDNLRQGGIDMRVTPYQLTVDARKFRDSVQQAVGRQLRKAGVTVISGPEVQTPTDDATTIVSDFFNYPAARFPVGIYQLGTVTVRGSFDQISNHLAAWSSMPNYLAVTDGLALTGTSPNLTATYNLVVVAFIRADQMPPAVPAGGGGGAGPTGFAGGVPPFGGPGGPPGAFGPPRGAGNPTPGAGAGR